MTTLTNEQIDELKEGDVIGRLARGVLTNSGTVRYYGYLGIGRILVAEWHPSFHDHNHHATWTHSIRGYKSYTDVRICRLSQSDLALITLSQ